MPHPVGFVKAHPMATILLLGTGYVVVPWLLGKVSSTTGVNINLPQAGGG
jgi:hypothetical protein